MDSDARVMIIGLECTNEKEGKLAPYFLNKEFQVLKNKNRDLRQL